MGESTRPFTFAAQTDIFRITLADDALDPQYLNWWTLFVNNVIHSDWVLEIGSEVGLLRSFMSFTNGISMEISDQNIQFTFEGQFAMEDGQRVSAAAKQFWQYWTTPEPTTPSDLSFMVVGKLEAILPEQPAEVQWPSFLGAIHRESTTPKIVRANAEHQRQQGILDVSVSSFPPYDGRQLDYTGLLTHTFSENEPEGIQAKVETILSNWASELEDLQDATIQLAEALLGQKEEA